MMTKPFHSTPAMLNVPAKNSYRMVILGASKVGKSCIVSRFLNSRFEELYTPTIEDFHRKVYNIRGDIYQLDILDTSGNHPFPAMRRLSILTGIPPKADTDTRITFPSNQRHSTPQLSHFTALAVPAIRGHGDVFILVFSLDSRGSFEEVQRLRRQIIECKMCLKDKTKKAMDIPMAVCGNKADRTELHREVLAEEGERLIAGDASSVYFEISAKKNANVEEMFRALFSMAKLPHEMSPALHRKISAQYCEALHHKSFRLKRAKELGAFGMVSPLARRPSVNSDLMYIKEKVMGRGQAREREKCLIQ
ncbi:GTP-binding protein Rhes-like isoform X2 [Mobula birostris]